MLIFLLIQCNDSLFFLSENKQRLARFCIKAKFLEHNRRKKKRASLILHKMKNEKLEVLIKTVLSKAEIVVTVNAPSSDLLLQCKRKVDFFCLFLV